MKPGKHQRNSKNDAKIYVEESTTMHNLLFCVHTLCHSKHFYCLVPRSVVNNVNYRVLCTVKAKQENKNIQQRALSSFITVPLYQLHGIA